jgi:hypothetical protein
MSRKKQGSKLSSTNLSVSELRHSGVTKLTLKANKDLKQENSLLKKSLKDLQNSYEKIRDEKGRLETSHALLKDRQGGAMLPEAIKLSSSISAGIVGPVLWSMGMHALAVCSFIGLISIYLFAHHHISRPTVQ